MSHYKPYPAYRDSGVEWIGQVPEHWQLSKVAWDMKMTIGWTPPTGNRSYYGGPHNWVSIADLSAGRISKTKQTLTDAAIAEMRGTQAPAGSLLFSYKLSIGEVALLEEPAYTNEAIAAFHPCKRVSMSFWKYAAPVILPRYSRINIYGSDLLNQELMNSARMAIPDIAEQRDIANGLDRETSRIDTLIAKKTRFIQLLKEKRQALITHAVTKGLDPNVKKKESVAKWLGDIPEHWEFVPSNSLFPESKERAWPEDDHLSATQKYGVIPLAEYERLEERQVTHAVKNLDQRKHAEIDDFVISMRSFEGGIERVKARGCVRSSYVVLKAGNRAHVSFFTYLFKSSAYIQGLQATATFIRDGQDLSYSNFRQVKLPCPSLDEQKTIADFLDKSVSRIDGLADKTQLSIDILKERRAAFITAAVTGQIDLREAA